MQKQQLFQAAAETVHPSGRGTAEPKRLTCCRHRQQAPARGACRICAPAAAPANNRRFGMNGNGCAGSMASGDRTGKTLFRNTFSARKVLSAHPTGSSLSEDLMFSASISSAQSLSIAWPVAGLQKLAGVFVDQHQLFGGGQPVESGRCVAGACASSRRPATRTLYKNSSRLVG